MNLLIQYDENKNITCDDVEIRQKGEIAESFYKYHVEVTKVMPEEYR